MGHSSETWSEQGSTMKLNELYFLILTSFFCSWPILFVTVLKKCRTQHSIVFFGIYIVKKLHFLSAILIINNSHKSLIFESTKIANKILST